MSGRVSTSSQHSNLHYFKSCASQTKQVYLLMNSASKQTHLAQEVTLTKDVIGGFLSILLKTDV